MLILTRRVGETLMIGDEVTVTVLGVKGNQVRNLSFDRVAQLFLSFFRFDSLVDFLAMHRHFARRIDADSYLVPLGAV